MDRLGVNVAKRLWLQVMPQDRNVDNFAHLRVLECNLRLRQMVPKLNGPRERCVWSYGSRTGIRLTTSSPVCQRTTYKAANTKAGHFLIKGRRVSWNWGGSWNGWPIRKAILPNADFALQQTPGANFFSNAVAPLCSKANGTRKYFYYVSILHHASTDCHVSSYHWDHTVPLLYSYCYDDHDNQDHLAWWCHVEEGIKKYSTASWSGQLTLHLALSLVATQQCFTMCFSIQ